MLALIAQTCPELKEDLNSEDGKIKDLCDSLMHVACLNYRFSFEMRPSQVAVCVMWLACLGQLSPSGQEIFTDFLATSLSQFHKYSKGRMNGIEKRLRECFAKSQQ